MGSIQRNKKELKAAREKALVHREQYLQEQAEIYELLGQKNKSKILQNIRKVEELRHMYGHIKYVLKDQHRQTITQITYSKNNTWDHTRTPEELEAKILEQ